MKGTIVLIGGGDIQKRGSAEMDRYTISLAGKRPTVAFIPTASKDDVNYVRSFIAYCRSIGAGEVLPILLSKESAQSAKKKIQQAQVIYLGIGDAKNLVSVLQQKGIVEDLISALEAGKIVAGISAGAVSICKQCIISKESKKINIIPGLGLTEVCAETNYNGNKEKALISLSKKLGRIYAIPEGAGITIRSDNVTMVGDSSKIAIFDKGERITALTSLKRPF